MPGRSQPQPRSVSYIDAPVEQAAPDSSRTHHSASAEPDGLKRTSSRSSSGSQRVFIKLQAPPEAGEEGVWEDSYNAGIAHIALDSSASGHEEFSVPQQTDIPSAAVSSPSPHRSSRPAYNPMQHSPQESQHQQQPLPEAPGDSSSTPYWMLQQQQQPAQQERFQSHSQRAFDSEGPVVRTRLPSDQRSGARNSPHAQEGGVFSQPGSAGRYEGPRRISQAAEPHRMRQSSSTELFSDLLRPDIGRNLNIHDRNLWSKFQ